MQTKLFSAIHDFMQFFLRSYVFLVVFFSTFITIFKLYPFLYSYRNMSKKSKTLVGNFAVFTCESFKRVWYFINHFVLDCTLIERKQFPRILSCQNQDMTLKQDIKTNSWYIST